MFRLAWNGMNGRRAETLRLILTLVITYVLSIGLLMIRSGFSPTGTSDPDNHSDIFYSFLESFLEDRVFLFFLLTIVFLIIMYMLLSASLKRRYNLVLLRGMGSTIWQLLQLVAWESIILWLIATAIGIPCAIFFSAGGLYLWQLFSGIPLNITISWPYIAIFMIWNFILLEIGSILFAVCLGPMRLTASFQKQNSFLNMKKIPANAGQTYLSSRHLFMRNRLFHRGQTSLRIILSLSAVLVLTFTMKSAAENYEEYLWAKETMKYEYELDIFDIRQGLDADYIQQLEALTAVTAVDKDQHYPAYNSAVSLHWPGWSESEYITMFRRYQEADNTLQNYDKDGDYIPLQGLQPVSPDNTELLAYYQSSLDEGTLDIDKFNSGEQCILILAPYRVTAYGDAMGEYVSENLSDESEYEYARQVFEYEDDDTSIRPGDIVTVETQWGTEEIEVAGIIRSILDVSELEQAVWGTGNIITGAEFFYRLFAEDIRERYNFITIHYDEAADFAALDETVEDILTAAVPGFADRIDLSYVNYREDAQMWMEQCMNDVFQSILYCIIGFLLYGMLMFSGNANNLELEQERSGIFRSLGMTQKRLHLMYILEYTTEALCIVLTAAITVLAVYLYSLRRNHGFDTIKELTLRLTEQWEEGLFLFTIFAIAATIFLIIYTIAILFPANKMIKESLDRLVHEES